jgi:hypothetical protein
MLVLCEGNAEQDYLNGFLAQFPEKRSRIKVQVAKFGDPQVMVQEILKLSKDNIYEEKWMVFDHDNRRKQNLSIAFSKAGNRVHIAFSRLCFEQWLLLHYEDKFPCFDYCNQAKEKICQLTNGKPSQFASYQAGVSNAKERAQRYRQNNNLSDRPSTVPDANPYTNVDVLLDAIETF